MNVIVGVGNKLRGDDYIGCYLVEKLEKETDIEAEFINAGSTPESFLEKIVKAEPEKVIILEAADMGLEPGEIKVIKEDEIKKKVQTTHTANLDLFMDYLKKRINTEVILLGVQIKKIGFEKGISDQVKKCWEEIIKKLRTL